MFKFRAAEESDVDQLIAFLPGAGLRSIERDRLRRDFADGRMRAEWSWLVEIDGVLAGRALWWGRPDSSRPLALDALDVAEHVEEPAVVAAGLLSTAHAALAERGVTVPLEYTLQLPRGWRLDAAACAAVGWRRDACRSNGLSVELERLQYAWTRGEGNVPATSGRVTFRPGEDEEFLDLFSQVARGSLDVETQRALIEMGEQAQARDDLEFYLGCPGEREWWRVAVFGDGRVAGFAIPSATPYHRNVGYLGVLPAWRGQGLVDDLLGAVTRIHAQAGAETITATTDTGNAPMAAAFERAGYEITEVRLILSAS
ncbi:MAG: GNAT family N-acetyltransferase [Actinomycetota bacterium]|nr:GNAT family N-acetyltransferase [Actinomycetota bacterium]